LWFLSFQIFNFFLNMDDTPRNDRSLQSSLLITLLFIAVLMGLGAYLHPKEEESTTVAVPAPKPEVTSSPALATSGADQSVAFHSQLTATPVSRVRTLQTRKESLQACRFKPAEDNDADSFWVATDAGDIRVKMYYVDAPDLVNGGAKSTQELMTHFNKLDEQAIRLVANMSKDWLTTTLSGRAFDVVTRWEKDAEESTADVPTYKAFVFFPNEDSKMVNLSSLLVRNGFAKIEKDCVETLPDDRPRAEYLTQLERYEEISRKSGTGAWNPDFKNVHQASFKNNNP
jgi:endonuclease YncB( thermonuclease family)